VTVDGGVRPFRWDVTRRSELGSLPNVDLPETYSGFHADLLACAARVVAFAGESDLVFVGRSPQPLFDLLSGLLFDTSWNARLSLLAVSMSYTARVDAESVRGLAPYLMQLELDPAALSKRRRPVAFIDIVSSGRTFGMLLELLHLWSNDVGADWRAVARRVRFVGLTERTKTSPNTRRWQQQAEWVHRLRPATIKNVSVPYELFASLNELPKTNYQFGEGWWDEESFARPRRDDEARVALALAVDLFDRGRSGDVRRRFARALADEPAMAESWFRSLALEIKR
jgi:hypothetical protein